MAVKRPSWRMDRSDAVLARVLLIALAVLYPLAVLVPAVVRWISGRPLELTTASSVTGPPADLAVAGASARFTGDVNWTVPQASAGQWIASLVPAVLTWVLLLAGCRLAGGLVRSTLAGQPFGPAGVRRIRGLALVVIGYGVLVPMLRVLSDMAVLWSVDRTGALALIVDLGAIAVPIVIGIIILVVAESFAIGQRLAEDVEGLV